MAKGKTWLTNKYSFEDGSNRIKLFEFYYLYSLEKACDLAGWEKLGDHDWYKDGAEYLMKIQENNGSWVDPKLDDLTATPFAVLFLKRASQRILDIDTAGSWATGKSPADTKTEDVETEKKIDK